MLAIVDTHPIQYRAPLYRKLSVRHKIPITVIYGSRKGLEPYHDKDFGVDFNWDINLLSGYESIFLSPRVTLSSQLRAVNPKAVLVTGYANIFYQIAIVRAIKEKYPIYYRAETTDIAKQRNICVKMIRDTYLKWFYGKCETLFYIGKNSHNHFKRLGVPEDRLSFSPYSIDNSIFTKVVMSVSQIHQLKQELNIPLANKVLLFSGKLSHQKGADILVDAMKGADAEMRQNTTLLFLGNGEQREELERKSKDVPVLQSIFVGFKNQTELYRYYQISDALILPSRENETWGLVVNEALENGLPCVVSDRVGCYPDLISDGSTGYVFQACSERSLLIAIKRVLQLCRQSNIKDKCLWKAGQYSLDKASEAIAAVYNEINRKNDETINYR